MVMTNNGSTAVEQSTHLPQFEGSNPVNISFR
jgi:hypothetical protein